jgi:hypothetical protein
LIRALGVELGVTEGLSECTSFLLLLKNQTMAKVIDRFGLQPGTELQKFVGSALSWSWIFNSSMVTMAAKNHHYSSIRCPILWAVKKLRTINHIRTE